MSSGQAHSPAFVALIPGRLAATRLPRKPLADLAGVPMIVRVARQARASGATRVAIATDAHEIEAVAHAHHIEAVMTRADHPTGTDRLAEAVVILGLEDDAIVVNVQGDEPLIPPSMIAAVAQRLAGSPDCVMATAAHAIDAADDYLNPNVVKVVCDRGGRALYFSRAPLPFDRDALAGFPRADVAAGWQAPVLGFAPLRHIGIYAYRVAFLRRYASLARSPLESIESLEQLRVLWHGERIAVELWPEAPPAGVDTPEDLDRVRALLATGHAPD